MPSHYPSLNPEKALIWRIVHRDNLPWIWRNGLHCGNSQTRSPTWANIGSADLIGKRATHPVPVPPGGVLNDFCNDGISSATRTTPRSSSATRPRPWCTNTAR